MKVNVVFIPITFIGALGGVGGYAIPIFARMVMAKKSFKVGPRSFRSLLGFFLGVMLYWVQTLRTRFV